ncbi:vitelline membrane outer layer protein 1 homolog [Hemicordylus capensis]|uniref:vitelline membrane outer layer protein 1 homolog n=1 Tax=Hemicordylus capensis TaxID=884348 RepID=UPI0023025477|nr:vitelline membrane outer layer protein 1 homolog [Hemicordylus capensis]
MQSLAVVLFLSFVHLTSALDKIFVSANGTFAVRKSYSTITVSNGGSWGYWTWIDKCPEQSYAIGFSIKVEEYRGASDDTSLNGIRLFCSSNDNIMYTVESETGEFGHWSGIIWCPKDSILQSFQLKVEPPQGAGDDTAVNNIRFRCTKGAILETAGGSFGNYDAWSAACNAGGICGIQTKQEPYGGFFVDDTALNDVRLLCCQ